MVHRAGSCRFLSHRKLTLSVVHTFYMWLHLTEEVVQDGFEVRVSLETRPERPKTTNRSRPNCSRSNPGVQQTQLETSRTLSWYIWDFGS